MAYAHGKPLPQAGHPGSAVWTKKWKLSATHGDMQTYLLIESAKKSWFGTETEAFCEYVCKLVAWEYCIAMFPCFHSMFPCFVGLEAFLKMFGPRHIWTPIFQNFWRDHSTNGHSMKLSPEIIRAQGCHNHNVGRLHEASLGIQGGVNFEKAKLCHRRAPQENGEFSPTNNGDLWWFIL